MSIKLKRIKYGLIFIILIICMSVLFQITKVHASYKWSTIPFRWVFAPNRHPELSNMDDGFSDCIELPFEFPFYDDVFTHIRIHTNGFVTLSCKTPSSVCGQCYEARQLFPDGQSSAPDYIIAPWWGDWNPKAEGSIYYGGVNNRTRFVIEWWHVRPYGANPDQAYTFSLQLYPNGRFDFLYRKVDGGYALYDYGSKGSIGNQPRYASRYAQSYSFTVGYNGGKLSNNLVLSFTRISDNLNHTEYNKDSGTPDIVERWAPVIWQDVNKNDGRCDFIVPVNYDGDLNGANNAFHLNDYSYAAPGMVYYSLVETTTHSFIGYYFYHAKDCTNWSPHEHDMEGAVLAINRSTGELDAVLTNVHGKYIPYVSAYNKLGNRTTPMQFSYTDSKTFSYITIRDSGTIYDTIGLGIESETHAVWGRWHNKCVIGPQGSPSGCDDSHGGDGIVYYYKNYAEEPSNIKQYPNWQWVGYDLKDIADLFILAHKNWSCGQWEPYALFRCDAHGVPWDKFNAFFDDAGDLPWAWGLTNVVDNACKPNMLINPGWIFWRYFYWPTGTFNSSSYTNNWYSNYLICN